MRLRIEAHGASPGVERRLRDYARHTLMPRLLQQIREQAARKNTDAPDEPETP